MKNLTLKQQLWTTFGGLILLVFMLGGAGLWLKAGISAQFARLSALQHKVQLIAELESNAIHNARVGATMLGASGDRFARLSDERTQRSARIDAVLKELDVAITLPEGKRLLGELEAARGAYLKAQNAAIAAAHNGDAQTAQQLQDGTVETTWRVYEHAADALRTFENSVEEDAAHAVEEVSRQGEIAIVLMTVLAVVIAVTGATLFARSLFALLGGEPVEAAREVERIAAGDLAAPIRIDSGRERSLLGQMERMRQQLNEILHQLATHATTLTRHAEALASASQQTAGAASRESDAAARMAATVEEMTVSIAHVSDNAGSTSDTAHETGALARQGAEVILDLAAGMESISRHVRESAESVTALDRESEQIRSVLNVIQDIADQTNLLALNAAIEAARAGESGRGFAVVADEVRKLAERTALSTRDIARMIGAIQANVGKVVTAMERSIDEVGQGEAMAGRAGEAIRAIQAATQDVVRRVADISGATRENSSASHEVARTVEQIAQLSEENSGAAQQLAGTARTLSEVAVTIHGLTSRFRTA